MTSFRTSLVVSPSQLDWINNRYNELICYIPDCNVSHYGYYGQDYERNRSYYKSEDWRKEHIEIIDKNIENVITENFPYFDENDIDSNLSQEEIDSKKAQHTTGQNLLEKFQKFVTYREEFIGEVKKYTDKYTRLGFYIDSVPNFVYTPHAIDDNNYILEFKNMESPRHPNHSFVRNPVFLGVFLQKFMHEFTLFKPIKFKYLEFSPDADKNGGLVTVDYFNITIFSLDDLLKANIELKMEDLEEKEKEK